jgi:hypothetical protein
MKQATPMAMKLFSSPSTTRKAAAFMLALFAFALASGVANACLLQEPSHTALIEAVEVAHAAGAQGAHGHAVAASHNEEDISKAPCLKACDEGSQALQYHSPADPLDPGAAPLVAVGWALVPMATTQRRAAAFHPPVDGPPERVRYSRWAL